MTSEFPIPTDAFAPSNRWASLSPDDRQEFLRLRTLFHDHAKLQPKDRRSMSFSQDLLVLLEFIERSSAGREDRAILVGLAFAGPYICVNTRQLKALMGRCKSSINGSFHVLGYASMKSKASECLAAVLPSLTKEPPLLRQWTVRCASDRARFCFASRHCPLPFVPDEIVIEVPRTVVQQPPAKPMRPIPLPILGPKKPEFDLSPFRELELPSMPDAGLRLGEMWDEPGGAPDEGGHGMEGGAFPGVVPRSQSAMPQPPAGWFL
jgi:hypothetical protein